jgi:hypothetical protein
MAKRKRPDRTVAKRMREYRARLRAQKAARASPPSAPPPSDRAIAAVELIERLKTHPREGGWWLRGLLGQEVAETIGYALVPPRSPLADLFPMPDQHLAYYYRRGMVDEARLRDVRDAINRLLAHPPPRDWDPFRDDPA